MTEGGRGRAGPRTAVTPPLPAQAADTALTAAVGELRNRVCGIFVDIGSSAYFTGGVLHLELCLLWFAHRILFAFKTEQIQLNPPIAIKCVIIMQKRLMQ